ncbi:hypothetical protein IGI37_001172 [Enterococcus sp. AZ194]|uniref:CDP-glycerol glycerophosphotransferase family protein n=1 Tax=Enterococcus sp. AZ194 TaxID=2774629 RepID=UPI003F20BD39
MKIAIVGYNIFGVGGTSRSNINLVKEVLAINSVVTVFNTTEFTKKDVKELLAKENLSSEISFAHISEITRLNQNDIYILTRESLFLLSRLIKSKFPESKIVGEIHAPLDQDKFDKHFYEDSIDLFRVSTPSILDRLKKLIHTDRIISFPVSIHHINYQSSISEETQGSKNFFIYSRFDEVTKDISYAIRLMNYSVNTLGRNDFKLYINGVGPGEVLYKNLINSYKLTSNVYINSEQPKDYIYLSTGRYETFGYSIMEAFAAGKRVIMYGGDDGVLKEIYNEFETIGWLTKDIESDGQGIIEYVEKPRTNEAYLRDVSRAKMFTRIDDYGENYINKIISSNFHVDYREPVIEEKILNEIYRKHGNSKPSLSVKIYSRLKRIRGIRRIILSPKFQNQIRKYYKRKNDTDVGSSRPLRDNFVFVESFHGRNFSGDPKYLALALKKAYPKLNIFVSSANQLVDMEIYDFGFIPVRTGSALYVERFQQSRCAIVNGNTLDKTGKNVNQIILQTWHGFPLKKMVSDLENEKQRSEETEAFIPRMLKWDYLLSSSERNTEYITSAFSLSKNNHLEVLQLGAPRNEYLIRFKNDVTEISKIHFKYFSKPLLNKRYILYCPTWRKDTREAVSKIDLIRLVNLLPKNYELIVKLHPNESNLRKAYANLDARIHCFYNELVDIQELYLISEILVTDYSSAMFDYAHLNRKIIVLQEDAELYAEKIGWYFDLENLTGISGEKYSEKQLADEIIRPFGEFSSELIIQELMNDDCSESTDEIVDILSNKISWE